MSDINTWWKRQVDISVKPTRSCVCGKNKVRMPAVRCENNSARICGHTSRDMRCAFAADCVAARHVNSRRAKPRAGGGKGRREEKTRWRWIHGSFELFGVRLKCHWRKRAAGSMRLRGEPYFVSDTTALLSRGGAWSCRYYHVCSWIVRDPDLPSACFRFLREVWDGHLLS